MPFPVDESAIQVAEEQLGRTLPLDLRNRLMRENGGEVWAAGDDWTLHPVWDPTDKRTKKRTTYHIVRETQIARERRAFPEDAISIAADGSGDRLIIRRGGEAVHLWEHETGESHPVGVIWNPYASDLDDQAFQSILSLPGEDRYDYFIRRAAADKQVWSLTDARGWVLSRDDGGTELFPVWPNSRFARASAVAEWAGAEPSMIPLAEWLESWIPDLSSTHRGVSVFPSPSGEAAVVHPERLRIDLKEELSLLE